MPSLVFVENIVLPYLFFQERFVELGHYTTKSVINICYID